jgi:hypothetical protein
MSLPGLPPILTIPKEAILKEEAHGKKASA